MTKPISKKAIIRNGQIIYDTDAAIAKPNETAAYERREAMKVKHRKDLLQPNETQYYKAYPNQAEDLPDETRRLLS